jgi:TonB-linked SusC/RagA family outer membrane protein
MPTQRVDQALQGRSTGVFILNTDGSPGGNTMIRIRGLNSINGGNQPLIVVDGLQGANINQINPNDIASMEILKDASATAIYGSRGANGVILITTKLGKVGKPVIDAGYNVGFQKLARKLPVMSAGDFARTFNKFRMTQTDLGNIPEPEFTDQQIAEWDRVGGTDWQDVVYQTGVLQNTNLAISGATDKLKYMISSNYLDHKGILLNSKYSRISLRANLSADITDWVDFGLNYSYTKETYKSPSFKDEQSFVSQVVNNAPRWAPTEAVYDEEGNYRKHTAGFGAYDTWNPKASAVEPLIDNPTYQNNANLFLNFKLMKGLSLKVMGGAQFTNYYYRDYYNLNTRIGVGNNGYGNVNESISERYQNTNILTYDNTIGIHHITFTGVIEQISSSYKGSNMTGRNFLVDQLNFDNMAGAKFLAVSSSHSERSLMSYMGRINYGLMDKYLATISYRADGSSVFGADNKWGFFPSGSLAWRVSQENFLKDSPILSDLKLRGSYGITGNQGINPYSSLSALGSGSGFNYPWNGQNTDIGFGISRIANPNLKWESTSQIDLGFDISFFKGRLTSTFDVYKKVTKDLLMSRELPGYVGVSSVLDNIGSIENKGLEFMIGGDPLVGDLKWNTSFNISLNRNKVLDLGPGKTRLGYAASSGGYNLGGEFMFLEVGQPFGLMNGWKYLGMWRSDQDAEARSFGQLPGMPHYADISGKDGVPDGVIDTFDRTTIGNGYPKFTWGFTNLFTYKGMEMSFLIMGSHGNDLFNTMRIRRQSFWEGNDPALMNPWTESNQDSDIPALYDGKYVEDQLLVSKISMGGAGGVTSQWVEDASFVRLKTVTLAYSFEQRLLKSIGFTKARIYVSGTNLLTITDYTGYDPEVAAFANNDATIGVDLSVYPSAKSYTFGIDFTF